MTFKMTSNKRCIQTKLERSLYRMHDYNAHHFALLGCKVDMYEMPDVRELWASHTVSGYYIGNSKEHYRNHNIWVKETKSVCAGKTVFFNHKYLTQPTFTTSDAFIEVQRGYSNERNHDGSS